MKPFWIQKKKKIKDKNRRVRENRACAYIRYKIIWLVLD